MFQAKKWVKPGSAEAVAAAAAAAEAQSAGAEVGLPSASSLIAQPDEQAAAARDPGEGAGDRSSPVLWEGQSQSPTRKWVKGQTPTPAAPPQAAQGDPNRSGSKSPIQRPPGAAANGGDSARGRVSISVTNLDPGAVEDNLWKFFGQAGRIASVKIMPRKPNKPHALAFVNFADGTLKKKCLEMCMVLNGTAPSWNGGQTIGVEEQGTGERKPKETPEQKEDRLAKLRLEFPYMTREDPAAVVRAWTERESQDGAKKRLTKEQHLELLFGAPLQARGGGGGGDEEMSDGEDRPGRKRGRAETPPSSDEAEPCESEDEEDRMEREGMDDWRVGRSLIGKMGYCGEGGLGFNSQGVTSAIVAKPRFGTAGLGSTAGGPGGHPAGIPRKRPNLSPNLSPRLH